jgi:PAT family beta-lactamase induction signal transducer AmpG
VSLAERKGLRLGVLIVMYVAQGIPWGFTAVTLPAYFAAHGVDKGAIGVALAGTTLPYSFKWVVGPIIDSFTIKRFGRRKPWIVFAQTMMALTIGAMLTVKNLGADLHLLATLVMVHTCFNALQDVAVDALAVDLLDEKERGLANGLMYGAKYGGGAIGGAGLSWVIHYSSLRAALLVQVALLLAIAVVPLLVRERDGEAVERSEPKTAEVLRALAKVMSTRSAFVCALAMLTLTLVYGTLTANSYTLFEQVLGWSPEKVSSLSGGYGLLAGLVGSMFGGFIADKVGHKQLAMYASIAAAAGWTIFALGFSLWKVDAFVYPMSIWEGLTTAMMSTSLFALCMDLAYPPAGASQFAMYMAFGNFATTLGYLLAGSLPASWSYRSIYFIAAVVQVCVTLLLLAIDPQQTRRELPPELPPSRSLDQRAWGAIIALLAILVPMTIYIVHRALA